MSTCWMWLANLARFIEYGLMTREWYPRKLLFQTPISPIITGMFFSRGAVAKCSSTFLHPFKKDSTVSKPYWSARGTTPTAEQTLYLPPTQSQNPKVFALSMPNAETASRLEEQAIMCRITTSGSSPIASHSHARTVRALSIVSAVVKVLETTMTIVSSGSRPWVAMMESVGSTLLRNLRLYPSLFSIASLSKRSTSCMKAGPR
mmetsp:Transcript_33490/g.78530  ORF Transcript_33490/g.78530 Transcript_33490/m.78530 type:complete len:204 (+) Transcript_33490:1-612(+)